VGVGGYLTFYKKPTTRPSVFDVIRSRKTLDDAILYTDGLFCLKTALSVGLIFDIIYGRVANEDK